jgi:hypothetical protein
MADPFDHVARGRTARERSRRLAEILSTGGLDDATFWDLCERYDNATGLRLAVQAAERSLEGAEETAYARYPDDLCGQYISRCAEYQVALTYLLCAVRPFDAFAASEADVERKAPCNYRSAGSRAQATSAARP